MFKALALPVIAAAAVAAFAAPATAAVVTYDLGTITVPPSQFFSQGLNFGSGANTGEYTFTVASALVLTASSFTNTSVNGQGAFDFGDLGLFLDDGTLLEAGTITPRSADGSTKASLGSYTLAQGSYYIAYNGTVPDGGASVGSSIAFIAPAVPEPASWAMMITGFGLVGGMARSRKVKAAFA